MRIHPFVLSNSHVIFFLLNLIDMLDKYYQIINHIFSIYFDFNCLSIYTQKKTKDFFYGILEKTIYST